MQEWTRSGETIQECRESSKTTLRKFRNRKSSTFKDKTKSKVFSNSTKGYLTSSKQKWEIPGTTTAASCPFPKSQNAKAIS